VSAPSDTELGSTGSGFTIRDEDFRAIRQFLYDVAGISLGTSKRDLVSSRLGKRLRHHGLQSFGDYLRLVRTGGLHGVELQEFINALTTNKTDFFREPHHFEFLRTTLIPRMRSRGTHRLRIWSAGCSTGEEPYTLAMTLREHCPAAEGWDVKILASDIDTGVLAAAEAGVYAADRVGDVPVPLLRKYFLRGRGANEGKVAVRPELRDLITFRQINLIEEPWPHRTRFDAIFCRNVVIYFDRETQSRLLTRFADHLDPHGCLFLGHSENLHWMGDTFESIGNTIYRLRAGADSPGGRVGAIAPQAVTPAPARVLAQPIPKQVEHTVVLGDVKATRGPALLKTVLGSCVSACIYDPETGVGGMNHFSLPGVSDEGVSARYGAHAMELLITEVMKKGGDRNRLRAKVFGGSKVINVHSEHLNVGARNAEFVLKFLDTEGIPLAGQCLGGTRGLVVHFHPHTGQAQAKPLPARDLSTVVEKEQQFGRELVQKVESPADDITLF
jgi:chemotaxis protein methyltransferase CheR